jgi:hypothetical protein
LEDGRRLKGLTVTDEWTHESLAVDGDSFIKWPKMLVIALT